MYYRGAQAAIVVYDIQNQDSFQRAKTWVKELQRQVKFYTMNHWQPNEFHFMHGKSFTNLIILFLFQFSAYSSVGGLYANGKYVIICGARRVMHSKGFTKHRDCFGRQ